MVYFWTVYSILLVFFLSQWFSTRTEVLSLRGLKAKSRDSFGCVFACWGCATGIQWEEKSYNTQDSTLLTQNYPVWNVYSATVEKPAHSTPLPAMITSASLYHFTGFPVRYCGTKINYLIQYQKYWSHSFQELYHMARSNTKNRFPSNTH